MPRVSEAYREARRDQIVTATIRVLTRRGLRSTTMADIIEESGLSAGSVYSHFEAKNEILELVATRLIGQRTEALGSGESGPQPPLEAVRWWLSGLAGEAPPFGVVLQVWGEAAADAGLRAIVERRVHAIEEAFTASASRWLEATGGDPAQGPGTARAMLAICQGYLVRCAILGPQDVDAFLADVELLGVPAAGQSGG